ASRYLTFVQSLARCHPFGDQGTAFCEYFLRSFLVVRVAMLPEGEPVAKRRYFNAQPLILACAARNSLLMRHVVCAADTRQQLHLFGDFTTQMDEMSAQHVIVWIEHQ